MRIFQPYKFLSPILGVIALIYQSIFANPLLAQEYGKTVIFGDSLSDTGNIKSRLGQDYPPLPYVDNRYSNGPIYSELFQKYLGITVDPSLNFAYGGALSGTGNVNQASLPFLANTGVLPQISQYLATGRKASSRDLFVIYAGANDYFAGLSTLTPGDPSAPAIIEGIVKQTVTNLASAATLLVQKGGAKQIVFPNLPNLGLTPQLNTDPVSAAVGAQITKGHNDGLATAAQKLASGLNAEVYIVDFATLFNDMHGNPAKYGFSNVTQACILVPACITNPTEQQKYLFFDSIHPTTQAHDYAARFFAHTLIAPRTLSALTEYSARIAQSHMDKISNVLDGLLYDKVQKSQDLSFFLDLDYISGSQNNRVYSIGYDYDSWLLSLGIARRINDLFILGLMGTLSDGKLDYNFDLGGFDSRSYRLMAYIQSKAPFGSHIRLSFAGSKDEYEVKRKTGVANQIAEAKPDGSTLYTTLEARRPIHIKSITITPFVRAQYSDIKIESYREIGAEGLNLWVERPSLDPADLKLGAEIKGDLNRIKWNLEGLWNISLSDHNQLIRSRLVSVPTLLRSFEAKGIDQSYAQINASIRYTLRQNLAVQLGGSLIFEQRGGEAWSSFIRLTKAY